MKLLLTSNGVANPSIHDALVDLLGKPIAESSALFIPTGIYPFPGGGERAWEAMRGKRRALCANSVGSHWDCWNLLRFPAFNEIAGSPCSRRLTPCSSGVATSCT
jgi:hypothetical protein